MHRYSKYIDSKQNEKWLFERNEERGEENDDAGDRGGGCMERGR
jgi:hypothetical protein